MNKLTDVHINWHDINQKNNYWLKNSVIALALAGLYSIFLVILRIPYFSNLSTNPLIFRSALIVHVNLSVLVWLLSIICHWWNIYLKKIKPQILPDIFAKIAFYAMLIMAASPLIGENKPILNNYIPMLENIYFIIGLNLFGTSILLFVLYILWLWLQNRDYSPFGIFTISSAIMYIAVWLCFIFSFLQLQKIIAIAPLDLDFYYELLFWSGGHLLQFLYTQGLIWAWIYLSKNKDQDKIILWILMLNFSMSLFGLFGHLFYDITDAEFKQFYTLQMRYLGGIAPMLYLANIFYQYWYLKQKNINFSAPLICSVILFVSGGLIGILISGMNLTIPAHYHGSIVGITVAFMGIAYRYLGVEQQKGATTAIYTITIGQILHITGLAIAGGYGAMRKAPELALSAKAKIALGVMGGGGLLAIIGGLIFVFICAKKLYFAKSDVNVYNTQGK